MEELRRRLSELISYLVDVQAKMDHGVYNEDRELLRLDMDEYYLMKEREFNEALREVLDPAV